MISTWIKLHNSNAIVLGPELSYHQFSNSGGLIFNKLCDASDPANNIFVSSATYPGKVDIGSIHSYKFGNSTWSKGDIINYPYRDGANSLYAKIDTMLKWLSANGPTYDGELAITEFNLTHKNDTNALNVQDHSCPSFIAGQYMAECMAIGRYFDWGWYSQTFAIWPWSVEEGSGKFDLGMFDQYTGGSNADLRSTYNHLRMMAREFSRGRVELWQVDTGTVKAFGMRDCDGGAVLVMNQDTTYGAAQSYYFSLDNTAPDSAKDVYGNIDMEWTDKFVTSDNILLTNAAGNINAFETHVIVLNACGEIIKTYVYNENDAVNYSSPTEATYSGSGCLCRTDEDVIEWYELDPESNPQRIRPLYTALNENTAGSELLLLYPNPAMDNIRVSIPDQEISYISIYSSLGSLIYEQVSAQPEEFNEVDVSNFKEGIYHCSVLASDGSTRNGKFVVSR